MVTMHRRSEATLSGAIAITDEKIPDQLALEEEVL